MKEGKPNPSYAPLYCAIYPELSMLFQNHGYALAIHGSLSRDFDLIAIPWTEQPSPHEDVLGAIKEVMAIETVDVEPEAKAHGRLVYTVPVSFGDCFIDLSFMPVDFKQKHYG